ncbi:MAG: hypothetical protein M3O70_09595 [Actinomycetota bacterium]|nr:hypothetical protein [Actinomycetota bacterium]
MKRRTMLVAIALLMSLEAALLPAVGQAHQSYYCGHGSSGYTIVTRFERHWNGREGHWHENSHRRWGGWEYHPREVKLCHH